MHSSPRRLESAPFVETEIFVPWIVGGVHVWRDRITSPGVVELLLVVVAAAWAQFRGRLQAGNPSLPTCVGLSIEVWIPTNGRAKA